MKKFTLYAVLVLALILITAQPVTAAAPQISFNEESWDLGTHPAGVLVYHDLVITNTGDADLNITDVNPPCGCTIVDRGQYPKILAPGDEHTVNVSFNTGGYSGPVTKYIVVTSDDPDRPALNLVFNTNVIADTTQITTVATTTADVTNTPISTTTTMTNTMIIPTGTPTNTPSQSPVSIITAFTAIGALLLVLNRRKH